MVVKYICEHCGAIRNFPREIMKVVECVECEGLAVLEGSNALMSNKPDTVNYRKMRTDRKELEAAENEE